MNQCYALGVTKVFTHDRYARRYVQATVDAPFERGGSLLVLTWVGIISLLAQFRRDFND